MAVNVVSLFSGGGGLDLGFQSAGFQIIWAIDNNQNAVDTYKANIGEHIICEDINKVDTKKIPFADVIIGGVSHFPWPVTGTWRMPEGNWYGNTLELSVIYSRRHFCLKM